ncbi:MAG: hypothetical protein SWY16_08205 [Cyanobacteriota bacterium]|nr:hypothetical protein [Cyanobacteriota bacterium]
MTDPTLPTNPPISKNGSEPLLVRPQTVNFAQLWANSDWNAGSFRAKCLFGVALLVAGGFLAATTLNTPKSTTTVTINPNQQANDMALQNAWAAEYNSLTDFTRATVAAWDLSQNPDVGRMSLMQMAIENETLHAAQTLKEELTLPGSNCNMAPVRHELACGEGTIQSEILPEMSAAISGDSQYVLVEVDSVTGDEVSRREVSKNEVVGANLIRWQGILRAGAEYPRREFSLNFAQHSQLGTLYLDGIKNRLSLQGVVDYLGTQESGKRYWERLNGTMAPEGDPSAGEIEIETDGNPEIEIETETETEGTNGMGEGEGYDAQN